MWIDSHCHLHYDYAPKTTDDLIKEASQEGVSHLITVGTDLDSLASIQSISEKYPHVYHTVGVHPHDAEKVSDDFIETLRQSARHPKCRAIGEIGLDTYYKNSPLEIQLIRLRQQLNLAIECDLPVVIHSRDAETELLRELENYASRLSSNRPAGVIHCFTGTQTFGEACLRLGFYISFSGILTFKNAEDLRQCAKSFPLDRLLVETDSPYLAPVPFRGKKCEPRMVKQTGLLLAELHNRSSQEVAQITFENTKKVFGL